MKKFPNHREHRGGSRDLKLEGWEGGNQNIGKQYATQTTRELTKGRLRNTSVVWDSICLHWFWLLIIMIIMKRLKHVLVVVSLVGLSACGVNEDPGETGSTVETATQETVLFEDAMTANWQENWFLDGEKAIVEHRDNGLYFHSTSSGVSSQDKNKFREKFDSHHAVLWTRQEFAGDIRVSYEFTWISTSWANLLYIHAQGIGTPPYDKDIYAWRELRKVASMGKYFNYMNLLSISLRKEIRCRRYPWNDVERDLKYDDSLVKPMVPQDGLQDGKTYHLELEKRKKTCTLRIREIDKEEPFFDYTWDLTGHSPERKVPYVDQGRIGLRQMGGNEVLFRNFKVTRLPPE
jgi:hypothetical protein